MNIKEFFKDYKNWKDATEENKELFLKIYGNVFVYKNKIVPIEFLTKEVIAWFKDEEEDIYNKYLKITSSEISSIKQWKTGETIYYKGEKFDIIREEKMTSKIVIKIDEQAKKLELIVPKDLNIILNVINFIY